MREITGGSGRGFSQPLEAHFGLGDATNIHTLRVEWPSGIVQELADVPVDQILTVSEELPAPVLVTPALVAPGRFQFTLRGKMGQTCQLEVSQDLDDWTAVETHTLDDPPKYSFDVPARMDLSGQYYRVRVVVE
jgi:hypothetical protein